MLNLEKRIALLGLEHNDKGKRMEDIPRLDAILPEMAREEKAKEDEHFIYRPRVSNSGSCPRALTYAAKGFEPRPHSGRMALLFEDGNVHEEVTINWLKKTDYRVSYNQLGLDIAEIPGAPEGEWHCEFCKRDIPLSTLHGHIDGLILTDEVSLLFEHKGLGQFAFDNLNNEAPVGYIGQCCCYIHGLCNMGMDVTEAVLIVKNKNTSEYRQVNVSYDSETDQAVAYNTWSGVTTYHYDVIKSVVDLHSTVEEFRFKEGDLPDRPYEASDWHCKFCRFKDTCWDEYPEEYQAYAEEEEISEEDELYQLVDKLDLVKAEERVLKAQAKDLRSQVFSRLSELEVKSGKCGNVKFFLKSFNKKSVDNSLIPESVLEKATKFQQIQTLTTKRLKG